MIYKIYYNLTLYNSYYNVYAIFTAKIGLKLLYTFVFFLKIYRQKTTKSQCLSATKTNENIKSAFEVPHLDPLLIFIFMLLLKQYLR